MHPCPLLLRPTEWKNSYLKGTGTLNTGEEKPQNELISDPSVPTCPLSLPRKQEAAPKMTREASISF